MSSAPSTPTFFLRQWSCVASTLLIESTGHMWSMHGILMLKLLKNYHCRPCGPKLDHSSLARSMITTIVLQIEQKLGKKKVSLLFCSNRNIPGNVRYCTTALPHVDSTVFCSLKHFCAKLVLLQYMSMEQNQGHSGHKQVNLVEEVL